MGNIKYVLMMVSIFLSVSSSCLLRAFSNRALSKNTGDTFLFNAVLSIGWTLILGIWQLFSFEDVSAEAYFFGIIYGIIMSAFLFTKMCALSKGPVSLTTLIGSCAFVIATWFGVIYAHEPTINTIQHIGMSMLVISLILCINPKKSGERLTIKWFLYAFSFFIAGGFLGIVNKMFGKSTASSQVNAMMLTASLVTAILFTVASFIINFITGKPLPKIHKGSWIYIILCAITSCLYQRLNVMLAKEILSVIFFPVSNGSMVILSTIMGKVVFKEKMLPIQIIGIFVGIFAIVITGCSSLFY